MLRPGRRHLPKSPHPPPHQLLLEVQPHVQRGPSYGVLTGTWKLLLDIFYVGGGLYFCFSPENQTAV